MWLKFPRHSSQWQEINNKTNGTVTPNGWPRVLFRALKQHHLFPIFLLSPLSPIHILVGTFPASPACIMHSLQAHRLLSVRFSSLKSVSTWLLWHEPPQPPVFSDSLSMNFLATPRVISSSMNFGPFGLCPEECPPKPCNINRTQKSC